LVRDGEELAGDLQLQRETLGSPRSERLPTAPTMVGAGVTAPLATPSARNRSSSVSISTSLAPGAPAATARARIDRSDFANHS
jgi:hypothetical protein